MADGERNAAELQVQLFFWSRYLIRIEQRHSPCLLFSSHFNIRNGLKNINITKVVILGVERVGERHQRNSRGLQFEGLQTLSYYFLSVKTFFVHVNH